MFRTRFLQRLAVVLLLVAGLFVGIMTAASATADRFYVSRIIAWREADFRDFEKFPSRPVPAGPKEFSFEPAPENPPEYLRTITYRRDAPDPSLGQRQRSSPRPAGRCCATARPTRATRRAARPRQRTEGAGG